MVNIKKMSKASEMFLQQRESEEIEPPIFKIRASQISHIMTDPKTKKAKEAGELSETTKKYCQDWLKEQLYGVKKEITNKYIEKGILCEDEACDFYCNYNSLPYNSSHINKENFSNDFLTGRPDFLKGGLVDFKCSWDVFTFPLYEKEPPKEYFLQLQGYMKLLKVQSCKLAFILVNTPQHLIEKDCWTYCNKTGYKFDDMIDTFVNNHTYDNTPPELRIKTYPIEYDPEVIEKIQNRVISCREYINSLK